MYPVILKTIHGSHLYGLNHTHSDNDMYVVVDGPKDYVKHEIRGTNDVFALSLTRFLKYCEQAVPQSLEALFSPYASLREDYAPLLTSFRVGTQPAQERYRRTIRNFSTSTDFKRKRHAYRLSINLCQSVRTGTIRPNLTDEEIRFATSAAHEHSNDLLEDVLASAILGIDPCSHSHWKK